MKVKLWMCASLVGVLGVGLGAVAEVQATPSTATSTILAQATVAPVDVYAHGKTLDGKRWRAELETHGLTDGYVVDNKFEPGQSTGWHSHPGPSLIFVVSGSVTNYDSDARRCAGVTYEAGSSFLDPGGKDVHMLRDDGTTPAETIAVQFIPSGVPRRIDQPVPHRCNA
jgi:quercetin dioxygenase-like cupin family protein